MRTGCFREDCMAVMDLRTGCCERYAGYTDGSGRSWVLKDDSPFRVSYVNVGRDRAAYVFAHQLIEDPGMFRYSCRRQENE